MNKSILYFIIISLALATILLGNILFWQSAVLGTLAGLFYFIYYGGLIGKLLLKKQPPTINIAAGIIFLLASLATGGGILYYLLHLKSGPVSALILTPPLILFFIFTRRGKTPTFFKQKLLIKKSLKKSRLFSKITPVNVLYLLALTAAFYLLYSAATLESISSPWRVVSPYFFACYFAVSLLLIFLLWKEKNQGRKIIWLMFYFTLSFSVAFLVYPLGFGFDPFIHQAAEKIISRHGLITPKPLYYLGQYAVVVLIAKIFSLGVELIDRLLLPALSAIFLPLTLYLSGDKLFNKKWSLPALAILVLPFGYLSITTPQGLANLFVMMAVLFSFGYLLNGQNKIFIALLSLAGLIVHPLAGLPLVIFFILWLTQKISFPRTRLALNSLFFVILSFLLPLVFLLQAKISDNLGAGWNFSAIKEITWPIPLLARKFQIWLDFVYTYQSNIFWIFLAIAVYGYLKLRGSAFKNIKQIKIYPLTFLILLINYLILKLFVSFEKLIYYEQGNYAQRLLELSWYFLLPLFLYGLYFLILKIKQTPLLLKIFSGVLLAGALTSSLYLSYPRYDDYRPSRGFNVSRYDFQAARWIENNKQGDYLVLANQMVSAAALREFGFAKYFKTPQGELFYYPIPTSSKFYELYLRMVYEKASLETMNEAMNLAGVNTAYFVINDYWWRAPIIIEEAKISADQWIKISGGKVWVFKYIKEN